MTIRRHIAPVRFGLGLRLGETPPDDPEAWLERQITEPSPPPPGITSHEAIVAHAAHILLRDERANANQRRTGELRARLEQRGVQIGETSPLVELTRRQVVGWATRRLTSPDPFRERLVDFWANHFTTARRGTVGILPAALEHEAIRPHVTGRFADMLVAVSRHPAMLLYLNNARSIGPNSRAGAGRRLGLNENQARETLELHTLSPAGGYTQGDVQELAKILTGWSVAIENEPFDFVWRPAAHEPGPKMLLGRRFGEGEDSQEAALRFLAEHPATWRHLAVKLARHFVADEPPPEAVRSLEGVLRSTQGDLGAVARALIALPQAWDPPLTKFRTPAEHAVAAARALGVTEQRAEMVLTGMAIQDQMLWGAPQPNGWGDTKAAWATPEGLMRRADWVYTAVARAGRRDPAEVTEAALGPLAHAETVRAMRGAGSVRDAVTLLLASPEFMHR